MVSNVAENYVKETKVKDLPVTNEGYSLLYRGEQI